MVTEISGASLSHSVVGQMGSTVTQRVADTPGAVLPFQGVEPRDEQVAAASQVVGAFAQLQVRQDAINKVASVVREVGKTVEQAGQLLDKMEKDLGAVVKIFPPYPIGDPERASMLNSFGGLRRQIEALTFPPPEVLDAVARVLGSQGGDKSIDGVAPEQQSAALVAREKMWDIPSLDPLSASDAELGKALDQVHSAQSALEALRTGMWKDVIGFVQQEGLPKTQPEAQQLSVGTREQLAELGTGGIGANGRLLEQVAASK